LLDNNIQKVDTFHRCNVSRAIRAPERLVLHNITFFLHFFFVSLFKT